MSSLEIDDAVRASVRDGRSLYSVDADLIDSLAPDVIVTQDLCAVCAVSSGELASACPVDAEVLSLDPRTLAEVAGTVRLLGSRLGADRRGDELAARMLKTIESVAASVRALPKRRVFFAEWIDPPFCAGHWLPEMIDLAGGVDVLGRAGQPSHPTSWDDRLGAGAGARHRRARADSMSIRRQRGPARIDFSCAGGRGRRRCLLLAAGAAARGRRPPARALAAPGDRAGPGAADDRARGSRCEYVRRAASARATRCS